MHLDLRDQGHRSSSMSFLGENFQAFFDPPEVIQSQRNLIGKLGTTFPTKACNIELKGIKLFCVPNQRDTYTPKSEFSFVPLNPRIKQLNKTILQGNREFE